MILDKSVNWKHLLFEGIIFVLLGIFALTHPYIVTLSLSLILGSILIIAGLVQGFRALKHLNRAGATILLISAAFSTIAGLLLIGYPLQGILTLTLLLIVFFFIEGFTKMVGGWQLRPMKGWSWIFFSGIISFVLAILVLSGMPVSALWVIGAYLGIYLLILGSSMIMLSLALKNTR